MKAKKTGGLKRADKTQGSLDSYQLGIKGVSVGVLISKSYNEYVPIYNLMAPEITEPTRAVLDLIRDRLVETVQVNISEILDPKSAEDVRSRFAKQADELVKKEFSHLSVESQKYLVTKLVNEMLGLGDIEFLVSDPQLEEIVINGSYDNVWVFHKKWGWLKTNVKVSSESQIYNYASIIGRKVGRQITNLNPLMDAHLLTGDRVNATLFPISSAGNTITVRKFAREPWTIAHFISPEAKTMSPEIASLIWLCMEYEMNILIAGGTASGKTSTLNALLAFVPPNHRIISIEDTRELMLPKYLHWVPMTTREANPEGKGKITMLDLMVNSLRMRPDRIVLGETRRQSEAEVLFEAMHTGHSVYSTLHADRAEQVKRRLTNPPISLPEEMLESLNLIIVQYRHRKKGIRRTFEVAEVVVNESGAKTHVDINVIYRWNPKTDKIEKVGKSKRLFQEIAMHTGMSEQQIHGDMLEKQGILDWMVKNKVSTVNTVGKVIADYYNDKKQLLSAIKTNQYIQLVLS
ncbi:MAG: ATPase, T2SS/T4P/T4SS family, partial [Candidatus Micrarchaeota archaeon]